MGITVLLLEQNNQSAFQGDRCDDCIKTKDKGIQTTKARAGLETRGVVATHLLLHLELIHHGGQLGQDLVGLLVVLELGGDEVREVAEGLGGVEDLGWLR